MKLNLFIHNREYRGLLSLPPNNDEIIPRIFDFRSQMAPDMTFSPNASKWRFTYHCHASRCWPHCASSWTRTEVQLILRSQRINAFWHFMVKEVPCITSSSNEPACEILRDGLGGNLLSSQIDAQNLTSITFVHSTYLPADLVAIPFAEERIPKPPSYPRHRIRLQSAYQYTLTLQ